eukprot:CAMPEP_0202804502 /NCGR_PEP_ID=MMETSP1388-20130828/103671_1 /ASSEMBLY_ACC=CAM_ASM_000864 /TAXON_ID=37098 /ORGANISM="Isochrysis sp, Strain CCMP1244" /LENGTH=534 /DNA_ID=CAMNT_0049474491 /DNA_START=105 /DNA_END=1709 /DNA_ORIENTATION=-
MIASVVARPTAGPSSPADEYIPLRLNDRERQILSVLEGALSVSEYTDRVDSVMAWRGARTGRAVEELQEMLAYMTGLAVAASLKVSHEPCLEANADVFREAFEVGRRFKGMNPDKMRASYGKLIYMLQDATAPDVIRELGFDPLSRVQTVHAELALLSCLDLLEEPELPLAASPAHSAEAADAKAAATARLLARFADGDAERAVRLERCLLSLADHACLVEASSSRGLAEVWPRSSRGPAEVQPRSSRGLAEGPSLGTLSAPSRHPLGTLSAPSRRPLAQAHVSPVDAMLRLLRTHFSPASTSVGPGGAASASLQITAGRGGARLSHSHASQYAYVEQSLLLWRAVLAQLPRMWALAEKDLLSGGYRLRDTGQGRHRVQSAPNVGQLMSEVLRRLQAEQGGGWVGSSAVHLGDDDVPNALVWVDKYSQVPRILGPIAHAVSRSTLDSLAAKPGVSGYIVSAFGSAEACRLAVLADFFKHGFDGSGADNFFDAGSCIDGRLTSAWHFCAQLSKKPYYPLFQMSGFVGFDGAFGRR